MDQMKNTKPEKNTEQPNEIITNRQSAKSRHGVNKCAHSMILGEFSSVRCGCAQSFDDLFSSNESIYVYVTLWNELDLNSIAPPVCIHA